MKSNSQRPSVRKGSCGDNGSPGATLTVATTLQADDLPGARYVRMLCKGPLDLPKDSWKLSRRLVKRHVRGHTATAWQNQGSSPSNLLTLEASVLAARLYCLPEEIQTCTSLVSSPKACHLWFLTEPSRLPLIG